MSDFKPFTQVSRKGLKGKLKSLNKGKAALLVLFFLTEVTDNGIVEVSYSQIMAETGMGSATVSKQLSQLVTAGFIEELPDNPETGVGRYKVNTEIARFPKQTSETKVSDQEIRAQTSETKALPAFVVVVNRSESDSSDSDQTTTTTSEEHFQNESLTTEVIEVPVDPRLRRLWLKHGLQDELIPEDVQSWINRHGIDSVVKYSRWYVHARDQGMAGGGGWLRVAITRQWPNPPAGFDERKYMLPDELRQLEADQWEREKQELIKLGIEF